MKWPRTCSDVNMRAFLIRLLNLIPIDGVLLIGRRVVDVSWVILSWVEHPTDSLTQISETQGTDLVAYRLTHSTARLSFMVHGRVVLRA